MTDEKELRWPLYAAEGMPTINVASWRLTIDGLIDNPLEFTLENLKKLPRKVKSLRLTSVTGWSVRNDWEGVMMREILRIAKLKPNATHVKFYSAAGQEVYTSTVAMKDMEYPNAMLVYGVNGRPLKHEEGGPARALFPQLWGYKSVKWLTRIEFTDRMDEGYWESRGYPAEALIQPGKIHDLNSRTRREIKGGEITEF
jgi:DMSO/TMAO reductase YedYZ molybdopterin-dependent catalytic subunit